MFAARSHREESTATDLIHGGAWQVIFPRRDFDDRVKLRRVLRLMPDVADRWSLRVVSGRGCLLGEVSDRGLAYAAGLAQPGPGRCR